MRGLSEIVENNQQAVRQGNAQPGELIGTDHIKPVYYKLVDKATGAVVEERTTIAGAAKYNSIQSTLEFVKLDN